jgi:hypothetical protein
MAPFSTDAVVVQELVAGQEQVQALDRHVVAPFRRCGIVTPSSRAWRRRAEPEDQIIRW